MENTQNIAVEETAVGEAAPYEFQPEFTPRKRRISLTQRKALSGWLFVLPFALGMLAIYLPILLDSLLLSFSKVVPVDGVSTVKYVGLEYYKSALDSDAFLQSLIEGFTQLVLQVPAILIFSLFIAVVLNQKMFGRAVFRAIFFIPVIMSTGLMETIEATDALGGAAGIEDGTAGAGDQLLSMMDVERLFSSMAVGGKLVEYVVGLVNGVYTIIKFSGVQMLIFLAGLQSISPSIYEACQIEGATSWETFWKITFPMISPMILVNGIYTIIDSFTRKSNVVMAQIQGVYDTVGNDTKGIATAQSWMYFVMVLAIIGVFAALSSLFVFYQKRD